MNEKTPTSFLRKLSKRAIFLGIFFSIFFNWGQATANTQDINQQSNLENYNNQTLELMPNPVIEEKIYSRVVAIPYDASVHSENDLQFFFEKTEEEIVSKILEDAVKSTFESYLGKSPSILASHVFGLSLVFLNELPNVGWTFNWESHLARNNQYVSTLYAYEPYAIVTDLSMSGTSVENGGISISIYRRTGIISTEFIESIPILTYEESQEMQWRSSSWQIYPHRFIRLSPGSYIIDGKDYEVVLDTHNPSVVYCWTSKEIDSNIVIAFDEEMEYATLGAITITGTKSGSHSYTRQYNQNASELILNPSTNFLPDETVTITISTNVRDLSGNPIEFPYITTFKTDPASTIPPNTYSISGTYSGVTSGTNISISNGIDVIVSSTGTFGFTDLPNGTYTITPFHNSYSFNPPSRDITINNGNASAGNFSAAQQTPNQCDPWCDPIYPEKDTYLNTTDPHSTHGNDTTLYIGDNDITLLQFPLNQYMGQYAWDARLYVKVTNDPGGPSTPVEVVPIYDLWNENISYYSWNTGGYDYGTTNDSDTIGSVGEERLGDKEIVSDVNKWLQGDDPNYGWAIFADPDIDTRFGLGSINGGTANSAYLRLNLLDLSRPADLIITEPTPVDGSTPPFEVGQAKNFGFTISNAGLGDAKSFQIKLYLGASENDYSNELYRISFDPIRSGNSYTLPTNEALRVAFNQAGTFYVNIIVDSGSDVDESNEDNNTNSFGPFEVVMPNTAPVISNLPDVAQSEDTISNNVIDLWAYTTDAQAQPQELTFSIENTTNPLAGVNIDGNRFIDIQPALNWNGFADITIKATDPDGDSSSDVFRISIAPVNDNPWISLFVPDQTGNINQNITIDLTPYEHDVEDGGTNLDWSVINLDNATVSGQNSDDDILIFDPDLNFNGTEVVTLILRDSQGGETSQPLSLIWSDSNNAPYDPIDPVPSNDSTGLRNVNINDIFTPGLRWEGGDPDSSDSVVYDVYFESGDATPDQLLCANISVEICNPGTLNFNTKYYWQVIAKDNRGETTPGPIWNFTTVYPAPLPFSDGFESGSLGSSWETYLYKEGRVRVSAEYPYNGSQSLLLDDNTENSSTGSSAAAILHLNLSGASNVNLSFWWREFNDENDTKDGVFVRSSSLDTWCPITMSFNNGPSVFTKATINLDDAASNCSITFSSDFQIRFMFSGDNPIPDDGYAIDDVQVMQLSASPLVLINEIYMGNWDSIELYNPNATPVNMTGWDLIVNDSLTTTLTLPSFTLPANGYVVLHESAGTNTSTDLYFDELILWINEYPGAASLVDSNGQGIDFVRWGNSTSLPPAGTSWNGENPVSPPNGQNLGRHNASDTNSSNDWCSQLSSIGSANLSCETPNPRVVTITHASANPTSASSVNFTVTFSEDVTGVSTSDPFEDFELDASGVTGASITGVSGSGSVYTVTVNTGTGNGTLRLDIPDNATILDTSNNPLIGLPYISGEAYTIQKTTSSTFKSVAAYDGWITESSETSNAGGVMNSTNADLLIGDDTSDKQIRAILHFDTSALPDNAVVTAMVLKIKQKSVSGSNPFTSIGSLYVDMKNPAFGLPNLELGDFAATAKKVKSAVFNPNPVSGWFSARFNNGGKLYVNRTGTTQLRLYFSVDDNNNNVSDFIRFYSGNASAGDRPKLLITYYLP